MRRMRVCCAQGAAQGVWKEITRRVVGGSEAVCEEKSWGVLISVREDIVCIKRGTGGWIENLTVREWRDEHSEEE